MKRQIDRQIDRYRSYIDGWKDKYINRLGVGQIDGSIEQEEGWKDVDEKIDLTMYLLYLLLGKKLVF